MEMRDKKQTESDMQLKVEDDYLYCFLTLKVLLRTLKPIRSDTCLQHRTTNTTHDA
jgi:hypothetical protein